MEYSPDMKVCENCFHSICYNCKEDCDNPECEQKSCEPIEVIICKRYPDDRVKEASDWCGEGIWLADYTDEDGERMVLTADRLFHYDHKEMEPHIVWKANKDKPSNHLTLIKPEDDLLL